MHDRDDAAAQLIEMAENGDNYAQYLTGLLYRDGPVLIPDGVEALYWFEQAARRGHVSAQYALGKLMLSEDAEVRNTELGIQWLEYAAHNGSDCAASRLGKEYLRGELVERDTENAMNYPARSAEAGNQYAQYALGKLCLEQGNREESYFWFAQSAAQGNEYAQLFVDRWDNLNSPNAMLSVTRLLHHMGRIFSEQAPNLSIPGGVQIDRKRLTRLREKKLAMGHRADDREEYNGPSMSM
ncbi:MAG: sel1 repeat family protein, partial [Butyricicoccus sp.]|nr:sel1 repeat family protein [Butyricicoccus sp.]